MTLPRPLLRALKKLLRQPPHVTIGADSSVLRPWHIQGARHIHIGNHTRILDHFRVQAISSYGGVLHNPRIVIGDGVYIGRQAYFTAVREIRIGNGCVLSDHVYITDEFHGIDPKAGPIMEQPLESKGPVVIGERCFIGFRACVLPGVVLGENCIVGANSVVTKSFPANSMIAGSPARLIKTFRTELGMWIPPERAQYDGNPL